MPKTLRKHVAHGQSAEVQQRFEDHKLASVIVGLGLSMAGFVVLAILLTAFLALGWTLGTAPWWWIILTAATVFGTATFCRALGRIAIGEADAIFLERARAYIAEQQASRQG